MHIVTKDPSVYVVEVPPRRITSKDNRSKIVISSDEKPPQSKKAQLRNVNFLISMQPSACSKSFNKFPMGRNQQKSRRIPEASKAPSFGMVQ